MKFSLLLVSWNALEDTRHCLNSLKRQSFTDFETILVDNASKDGSADMVKKEFPFVKLIAMDTNTGFASANNIAAQKATGDLLFIVNTDTEFPVDLLAQLNEAQKRYMQYDIFSCQMIQFNNRNKTDCKGMCFHHSLRAEMIGTNEDVDPNEQPFDVFGATGGAMLIRRSVYQKIGLFDDDFFFNNEDVDFVLRAFAEGFKTLYLPQAKVYHKRSPNEQKIPDTVLYYIQRNLFYASLKNMPLSMWITNGPLHFAYNSYQFLKWLTKGKASIVLKAKKDALRMFLQKGASPIKSKKLRSILGKTKLS